MRCLKSSKAESDQRSLPLLNVNPRNSHSPIGTTRLFFSLTGSFSFRSRSQAGLDPLTRERVMASVTRYVSDSLRLTVNPLKSAVDRPRNRKYLGFTVTRNGVRLKVADKAIDKLKDRIRELTRRTRGHRLIDIVAELRDTLLGWKAYFGIAEVLSPLRDRQMGATQVTLLYLEAMGKGRLSGTAQARRIRVGSMEHQQKCARPVATVENPCAYAGAAGEVLQQSGSAISRRMTGICSLNRRVRSRTHGGVGGGSREAFLYPDWATCAH